MSTSAFERAHESTCKLVATFEANEARYLSSAYQEAEVRKDFIDKFFAALGWDVNHDEQTNPYEQEVKVEPTVSAGGQRRAGRSIIAILRQPQSAYNVKYFLGILNSKYFEHLYCSLTQEAGRVFAQVKLAKLKQLPIRNVDFSNKIDKAAHDAIVVKVDAMQEAKKHLAEAKTDRDQMYYENRCAGLDRQINRLVYGLYGLTEKEIQMVEQSSDAHARA